MGRLLTVLAAAAVLGAVFLLPRADEAHLLALDAHELLLARLGPEPPAGTEDARLALWQAVLIGPASRELPDGSLELSLYGMRLQSDGGSPDMTLHLELRRSLVRGLRQAADEADVLLRLLGETTPEPGVGASFLLRLQNGRRTLEYTVVDGERVLDSATVSDRWTPPDRTAVLPPLVAVALAILFRRPLLALFAGILAGTFLVERAAGQGVVSSLLLGLRDVVTPYFRDQFFDPERAMIIGFVVCMLAMVGVMTLAGGIRGLMDLVARRAGSAKSTQLSAYLMGLVIFFDDYANTILVGSTMRPLTDRARISREKLSFIVDSTAAPVAGLSIFSTWIAFEVSTFSAQLPAAGSRRARATRSS